MTGKLVELEGEDARLAKALIARFHPQRAPRGGAAAKGHRFFALDVDGLWVALAWIHDPTPFRPLLEKFNVTAKNAYFLRRIVSLCPQHGAVELLQQLCEKLKSEGKEALITLGLPDHSNALYREAGFEEVGTAPRSGHPVFVAWLQKKGRSEEGGAQQEQVQPTAEPTEKQLQYIRDLVTTITRRTGVSEKQLVVAIARDLNIPESEVLSPRDRDTASAVITALRDYSSARGVMEEEEEDLESLKARIKSLADELSAKLETSLAVVAYSVATEIGVEENEVLNPPNKDVAKRVVEALERMLGKRR